MSNLQPDFVDQPAWDRIRAGWFPKFLLDDLAPVLRGRKVGDFIFHKYDRIEMHYAEKRAGQTHRLTQATLGILAEYPDIIVPNDDWGQAALASFRRHRKGLVVASTRAQVENPKPGRPPHTTMLGWSLVVMLPDRDGHFQQVMLFRDELAPSGKNTLCTLGSNCSDAIPLSFIENMRKGAVLFQSKDGGYGLPNFILPGQDGPEFQKAYEQARQELESDAYLKSLRVRAKRWYGDNFNDKLPITVINVHMEPVPALNPLETTVYIVDSDDILIAQTTGYATASRKTPTMGVLKTITLPNSGIPGVDFSSGCEAGKNCFPVDMRPIGEFGNESRLVGLPELAKAMKAPERKCTPQRPGLLDSAQGYMEALLNLYGSFEKIEKALTL